MKIYQVEVSKRMEVKAESRVEAKKKARESFYSDEIKDEFEFSILTEDEDDDLPL